MLLADFFSTTFIVELLGCSKNKVAFLKFLFIAYDVWEQSEREDWN
jgi:hypothetical protein